MQVSEQQIAIGQHLTLSLTSWGRLGEAMAEHQGTHVFVFGGIPGERVVAEVVRLHRRYAAARVVEVLEPAPSRVEPPCPYYGECTGCQWQHMSYSEQLAVKREKVSDALSRVGGFTDAPVTPVVPSPGQLGYRNHARFTIGPEGALGFVHRETRQFVRIDRCLLMHDGVNQCLTSLQGKCMETTQLSIRAGQETGDTLVQPTLIEPTITIATGQKSYLDSIEGQKFRVSSPSFFQVNVEQAAQVADTLLQNLDLKSTDVVLDAYTGVGTFAVLVAPHVKKVIAVEESSAAVADARENLGGLENVELVLGKTEEILPNLEERPDVVILDPPRAGCHPRTLQSLLSLASPKIAYVSCDPETLARDLKILCEDIYVLDQVIPLDMFPQTHHVECVALLSRNEPAQPLFLASASPRRRELLAELGLEFRVMPADVPEEPLPGEEAHDLVRRLSLAKASAVAAQTKRGYVIGADSMVVHDGELLGKPVDAADARRMLMQLRGTRHQVVTGVTVIDVDSGRTITDSMSSDITLRNLSGPEIDASIASGTPLDKAGAYAVQDQELSPAESWEGCYSNIVGLPMCRLMEMLGELGYTLSPVASPESLPVSAGCTVPCPFQPQSQSALQPRRPP
ncbi:MAG: 23S rRNA (uracil(1939)-C(5))-methyltransferase RlmD [Chloroflexi bacterium]|nr:23S rRNA (uracil(1939)-C(5))-methyltransferase RlmD [Chloroflexota bacterium]